MIYTCHCTNCQRFTSSAFSIGMIVDEQVFHLTGIEPRAMLHTADSGRNLTRWVCPECGSWICSGAKPGSPTPTHFAPCAPEPWMTSLGYVRLDIFEIAANSPGSCYPMNEVTSRNAAGRLVRILQLDGGQCARSD